MGVVVLLLNLIIIDLINLPVFIWIGSYLNRIFIDYIKLFRVYGRGRADDSYKSSAIPTSLQKV